LSRREELGGESRTSSADGVVGGGNGGTNGANGAANPTSKALDVSQLGKKGIIGTIAQSVPRDWSWSTF
jgi:hypothetical protein